MNIRSNNFCIFYYRLTRSSILGSMAVRGGVQNGHSVHHWNYANGCRIDPSTSPSRVRSAIAGSRKFNSRRTNHRLDHSPTSYNPQRRLSGRDLSCHHYHYHHHSIGYHNPHRLSTTLKPVAVETRNHLDLEETLYDMSPGKDRISEASFNDIENSSKVAEFVDPLFIEEEQSL